MTGLGTPAPWKRQKNWPALVVALAAGSVATGQTSPDLRDAIKQLKIEAIEARQAGDVPEQPNFAARSDRQLDSAAVLDAMTKPADDDPFIDAYVRWQLTSFNPPAPWDQRQFRRLLRTLPPMVENPRGDASIIALFERAVETGPLNSTEKARLQELSHELDERTALAENLNRPALGLRDWMRDAADMHGPRRLQLMMEECAATIDAAWSTRGIKTRLSYAMSAVAEENLLKIAERRMVARQLHGLVDRHRRFVTTITFLADGTVDVRYANARVTQRDVDAWIERLAGAK